MVGDIEGLYSLNQIFDNKIFRIPDYQRGYSWKEEQILAFWEDLVSLKSDKIHYMGMVTVQRPAEKNFSKWKNEYDHIAITEKGFHYKEGNKYNKLEPFFIVDGQQRITTSLILLSVILENESKAKHIDSTELRTKFLYQIGDNGVIFKFGYEYDSNSYNFFVNSVLGYKTDKYNRIDNIYSENLRKAKELLLEKYNSLFSIEKTSVKELLLNNIRFNFYVIPEVLDIHTIFETMNYRGKPLSTLELLKNRLLFLTSIHVDCQSDEERIYYREIINNSWSKIYEDLAIDKDKIISDDDYLRIHWLFYFNHDKSNTSLLKRFKQNLLEDIFVKSNVLDKELISFVSMNLIKDYVESLAFYTEKFFFLRNPNHPRCTFKDTVRFWLSKINYFSPKSYFEPIILVALVENSIFLTELLKNIERYLFIVFAIGELRSNVNKVPFLIDANKYYRKDKDISILINKLKPEIRYRDKTLVSGEPTVEIPLIGELLDKFLKNRLKDRSDEGYLNWRKLFYFLYEFERHHQGENTPLWSYSKNISLVFPPKKTIPKRNRDLVIKNKEYNSLRQKNWQKCIRGYGEDTGQMYLSYTLGNIVLVNSLKKEDCDKFERKKEKYEYHTYSAHKVSLLEEWTPVEILERGIEMLNFIEARWGIEIDLTTKKQLLYLNKLQIERDGLEVPSEGENAQYGLFDKNSDKVYTLEDDNSQILDE